MFDIELSAELYDPRLRGLIATAPAEFPKEDQRERGVLAIAMANHTLEDFQDHQFSYERAHQMGLFEWETAEVMKEICSENRTASYYGGGLRPKNRRKR